MRYPSGPVRVVAHPLTGAAVVLAMLMPPAAAGQERSDAPADSAEILEGARELQRNFERFRQSRIPVETERAAQQSCDELIGTICIWFGGASEEDFPPEPPEVDRRRRGLIGHLIQADEGVDDFWITGQLVHYLVEQRDFVYAERVARECGIAETWWCSALLGYGLHLRGDFVEAEAAFLEALASMPEDERDRWTTPRYILPPEGREDFEGADSQERTRRWDLFWRLSDPLFILEGNDRLTDHYARLVEARNHRGTEHPLMEWNEFLEETLVRYGRNIGWSRTQSPTSPMRGGRFRLQDTRRVIGHHHPNSRGYLFPYEFIESPSDIPPESWITAPVEARTWYAPPYAPDFRGLETQVGRFRRSDEMLVVGAYRPAPLDVAAFGDPQAGEPEPSPFEAADRAGGPIDAALILVPEDSGPAIETWGRFSEGVLTLRAPPGRYVSSLEVFDEEAKQAWRARQGVYQVPLAPGLAGLSDLMILEEDAPYPGSLDEAIPHIRPGIRVRRDERFTVVWEVYGLQVAEVAQVTLGFTRGRPGFLARVGEFLGIIEPESPVEITFEDVGPDAVQSMFRAVVLELPDVEPGEYTLHLRLDLPGREPSIASRPIVVEG